MKNNKLVQDFPSRVTSIVRQMKSYDEHHHDHLVVVKVLRNLTLKFDHIVAKKKTTSSFELMGLLQGYLKKNEEKTFQVKGRLPLQKIRILCTGNGRGRGYFDGYDEQK